MAFSLGVYPIFRHTHSCCNQHVCCCWSVVIRWCSTIHRATISAAQGCRRVDAGSEDSSMGSANHLRSGGDGICHVVIIMEDITDIIYNYNLFPVIYGGYHSLSVFIKQNNYSIWLVVWNITGLFFYIFGISSSQLANSFFQRGRYTTNQNMSYLPNKHMSWRSFKGIQMYSRWTVVLCLMSIHAVLGRIPESIWEVFIQYCFPFRYSGICLRFRYSVILIIYTFIYITEQKGTAVFIFAHWQCSFRLELIVLTPELDSTRLQLLASYNFRRSCIKVSIYLYI